MVEKRLGCKWSWFWMGSEIRKPRNLKSGQMATILSKTFDIQTKMSGFQMVGTIAIAIAKAWSFENWTIWNPTFKRVRISKGQISDPHCIWHSLLLYCICLVSMWWREYWQRIIGWDSLQNLKKPSWILCEETYSGSYQQDLDPTIHFITSVNVP